jgi:hypothetical protein
MSPRISMMWQAIIYWECPGLGLDGFVHASRGLCPAWKNGALTIALVRA